MVNMVMLKILEVQVHTIKEMTLREMMELLLKEDRQVIMNQLNKIKLY